MQACGGSLPAKGQYAENLHNQISSCQSDFTSNLHHSESTTWMKHNFFYILFKGSVLGLLTHFWLRCTEYLRFPPLIVYGHSVLILTLEAMVSATNACCDKLPQI